jgi:hypothetical protein
MIRLVLAILIATPLFAAPRLKDRPTMEPTVRVGAAFPSPEAPAHIRFRVEEIGADGLVKCLAEWVRGTAPDQWGGYYYHVLYPTAPDGDGKVWQAARYPTVPEVQALMKRQAR